MQSLLLSASKKGKPILIFSRNVPFDRWNAIWQTFRELFTKTRFFLIEVREKLQKQRRYIKTCFLAKHSSEHVKCSFENHTITYRQKSEIHSLKLWKFSRKKIPKSSTADPSAFMEFWKLFQKFLVKVQFQLPIQRFLQTKLCFASESLSRYVKCRFDNPAKDISAKTAESVAESSKKNRKINIVPENFCSKNSSGDIQTKFDNSCGTSSKSAKLLAHSQKNWKVRRIPKMRSLKNLSGNIKSSSGNSVKTLFAVSAECAAQNLKKQSKLFLF